MKRAVGQIVVEPVVGAGAVDDHRRLARAEFFGKEFDLVGGQAGARGDFVHCVSGDFFLQKFEDRGDFGGLAIGELHVKGARQRRIGTIELDGLLLRSHRTRRRNGALLLRVPEIEDVFLAAVLEVGLAEEAVRARKHEQRHVGLFFHIRRVDEVLIDEQLGYAQRENAVGARVDAEIEIGVRGAGVVIGRNADNLGAVVAGLVSKMRVRDAGLRNVRSPEHDVFRVEPVGAFARLGLNAPSQRLSGRQVAVPVVERKEDTANVVGQAGTGAETDRAHGRE